MITKLMPRTTLLILCLLMSRSIGFSDIEPISLEDLAKNSRQILIGKIVRIHSVNGVRVAEAEVIESFKGNASSKIYFLAQPLWVCDITNVVVGESYLLFLQSFDLNQTVDSSAAFLGIKDLRRFKKEIHRRTGDSLFIVAHSGRGAMAVSKSNGAVTIWTDDVMLPKHIVTFSHPKKRDADFMRYATLKDVVTYLKEIIATQ